VQPRTRGRSQLKRPHSSGAFRAGHENATSIRRIRRSRLGPRLLRGLDELEWLGPDAGSGEASGPKDAGGLTDPVSGGQENPSRRPNHAGRGHAEAAESASVHEWGHRAGRGTPPTCFVSGEGFMRARAHSGVKRGSSTGDRPGPTRRGPSLCLNRETEFTGTLSADLISLERVRQLA
jgi:hypothetical protein